MAICSSDEIKTHIFGTSSPPSTFNSFFTQAITQVESVIEHATGIKFVATEYDSIEDEILDASGRNVIHAKYKPVRACSEINYRDANWTWTEQTQISDYNDLEYDGNKIYTKDYVIAEKGERNIKIDYTVGYKTAETPDDLKLCGILMIAGLFNTRNHIGFINQSVLGLSIALSESDHLFVKRTLAKYKNVLAL